MTPERIIKFNESIIGLKQKDWYKIALDKPKRGLWWTFIATISSFRFELQILVGKKKIVEDKCTKCGLCATHICPSGAITLDESNLPQFNEKLCNGCYGCVNLCPTLAIETKSTKSKQPYTTYRKILTKK